MNQLRQQRRSYGYAAAMLLTYRLQSRRFIQAIPHNTMMLRKLESISYKVYEVFKQSSPKYFTKSYVVS
jgi:hypothetical protein